MSKEIFTIGYSIPAFEDREVYFDEDKSLMDADILLVCPNSFYPMGDWVSFTTSDSGCYNIGASKKYKKRIEKLRKEIHDHLNSGGTIFVVLSPEVKYELGISVTTVKNSHSYTTESFSNYRFLPIKIGPFVSTSGKHIQFSGNSIFSPFFKVFKENLEYKVYTENLDGAEVIFTGKDAKKILGAVYRMGKGHLVTLPMITFNEKDFTTTKKDENGKKVEHWNQKGLAFGNKLIQALLEIDKKLSNQSEKDLAPEWATKKQYLSKQEETIAELISGNNKEIKRLGQENEQLVKELEEAQVLKGLLYEQGKPLEQSVIKALTTLGYRAENFDDGDLEIDQVIVSPEGQRYIGECEGRDNKDIDVVKFRQLVDILNADFAREEVGTKAFGVLFGNAERLKDPTERKLDFTAKCKSGAEREKMALVRTTDLFEVAKYLIENNDKRFQEECRKAIHSSLGKVVIFPKIPKKKLKKTKMEVTEELK